eukprot:scaffold51231_cov30-Tisochrysis_lutea.AAC.4
MTSSAFGLRKKRNQLSHLQAAKASGAVVRTSAHEKCASWHVQQVDVVLKSVGKGRLLHAAIGPPLSFAETALRQGVLNVTKDRRR